jgi:hypothetical protein
MIPLKKIGFFIFKILGLCLLVGPSIAYAQEGRSVVHVLYGDLKPGQHRILERVFRPKLNLLSQANSQIVVKENLTAKTEEILGALRDPQTLGIIFLGHPAIKTTGEYPNKEIIHGHLKDGLGRYLPKKLFRGAHKNLRFLSVLTCHESAILPLYLDQLSSTVKYYKSPVHGLDALKNPLYEFTSFYSTPKVLEQLAQDLHSQKIDTFSQDDDGQESIHLTMKVRDLISQRFSYTVEVNGELVGVLHAKKNKRGRLLNELHFSFSIKKSSLAQHNSITIAPDDPKRPRPDGLLVVDDILIDSIQVDGQEILTHSLL